MVRTLFACLLVAVMSCTLLAQNTAPQVTVWLYRPNADNFGSAVPLYVDGRKLLNLGIGRYFGIQLPPGLHAFNWTNLPGARHVVIPVGTDPQGYFEVTFTAGSPFLSMNPMAVDKAMQAMVGLRPVDPNGVFDNGVMVPAQPLQAAFKAPSPEPANNAKPTAVSVPVQQNVAAKVPASVSLIASSNVVTPREKTPKKEAVQSLPAKAEKETLWVKALTHDPDVVTQQHKIPIFRLFTDKVQAENGQIYTISCSAHWIVSNCGPMVEGDSFKAEVEKKTMWITAHKEGNLWTDVRIRYNIVDIR